MDPVIASASFSLGTRAQLQNCNVSKTDEKLSVALQSLKGQCSALMSTYLATHAGEQDAQDEPMAWEDGSDDEEEGKPKKKKKNKGKQRETSGSAMPKEKDAAAV